MILQIGQIHYRDNQEYDHTKQGKSAVVFLETGPKGWHLSSARELEEPPEPSYELSEGLTKGKIWLNEHNGTALKRPKIIGSPIS